MNPTQTGSPASRAASHSGEATRAIVWPDHEANLLLAQKTRRAVRDAVITTQERRLRQRRSLGLALMAFAFLLLLLAPAIWNGLEDLRAGDHLFDLPALVAFSVLMLFPGMLAALFAFWRSQRDVEHDRGGFETFRPIEK